MKIIDENIYIQHMLTSWTKKRDKWNYEYEW